MDPAPETDTLATDVPDVEAAPWLTLHPNSLIVGRVSGAVTTAMMGVVAFIGLTVSALSSALSSAGLLVLSGTSLAVLGAAGVLAWLGPALRYRHTRYRIDELGLLIRRGRLFRSEVAVLRSRIQHTDVTQGPLERAFGLGVLVVHTAGTVHAELRLSGIAWDEARRLRAALTGLDVDDAI